MKDFSTWFKDLISDERWAEQAGMNHRPETFREVANKVYVNGLADADAFFITPMKEHRQHVFNKVSKLPHDKVRKKWNPVSELKPTGILETAVQPSEEEIKRRLAEWQKVISSFVEEKRVPALTNKEAADNKWRPKPPEIKEPTPVQKLAALNEHIDKLNAARAKFYRDAFPEATDEEVHEYLKNKPL